jgi:hypothetical protein
METIKKFAFHSTTSSLSERQTLFDELFSVLKTPKSDGKFTFISNIYIKAEKFTVTTSYCKSFWCYFWGVKVTNY